MFAHLFAALPQENSPLSISLFLRIPSVHQRIGLDCTCGGQIYSHLYISSSIPGPPILTGWSTKYWAQTSRRKLYQSTAVLVDICMQVNMVALRVSQSIACFVSFIILPSDVRVDQRWISRIILSISRWLLAKNVPSRNNTSFLQAFRGHLQHLISGVVLRLTRSLPHTQSFFSASNFLLQLPPPYCCFHIYEFSAEIWIHDSCARCRKMRSLGNLCLSHFTVFCMLVRHCFILAQWSLHNRKKWKALMIVHAGGAALQPAG